MVVDSFTAHLHIGVCINVPDSLAVRLYPALLLRIMQIPSPHLPWSVACRLVEVYREGAGHVRLVPGLLTLGLVDDETLMSGQ